jgi:hypothetical protein
MRSLAQPANPLYQPLDAILGTPAAIRILRVLSRRGGVLSPATIASRARINRAGAGRTLARLSAIGIVEVVGQGRYVSYRLRTTHPFAQELMVMFKREAERVEGLFDLIRTTAERMRPAPMAIWLLDSGSAGELESRVEFAIVGREEHIDEQTASLQGALTEFGDQWAIDTSLLAITPGELRKWVVNRNAFWLGVEGRALALYGSSVRQIVLDL